MVDHNSYSGNRYSPAGVWSNNHSLIHVTHSVSYVGSALLSQAELNHMLAVEKPDTNNLYTGCIVATAHFVFSPS